MSQPWLPTLAPSWACRWPHAVTLRIALEEHAFATSNVPEQNSVFLHRGVIAFPAEHGRLLKDLSHSPPIRPANSTYPLVACVLLVLALSSRRWLASTNHPRRFL